MMASNQLWDKAFEHPKKAFATTCPLFGAAVARLAGTGDFITLKDDEGRYRISGTVRGTKTKDQLTNAHRGRLRAWLREQHKLGEECPMTDDGRLRFIVEQELKDALGAFRAHLMGLSYSAPAIDMRMRGATQFAMFMAGRPWVKGDRAPPDWKI